MAVVVGLGMTSSVDAGDLKVLELDTAQAVSNVQVPSSMLSQLSAAQLAQTEETIEVTTTETEVVEEDEFSFPISVNLAYSLYSDYIWRFLNLSEYAQEGREKPNHQLAVDFGFSLGDYGTITYGAWFEWYAAQKELTGSGANIQEIDHWYEWSYTIDPIMTDIALGMTYYTFPNNNAAHTVELYLTLAHNDAWMWKWLFPDNEEGVLNPSFYSAWDVDFVGGLTMEFSFSHDFELFENFTLTPGWMIAVDGGYMTDAFGIADNSWTFAGTKYSLAATYDIGNALQIPAWAGDLTISGELYWNNPWSNFEDNGIAQDVFWGGMTMAWSWGG
jgi:hypothetical protein